MIKFSLLALLTALAAGNASAAQDQPTLQATAAAADSPALWVVPALRSWNPRPGTWALGAQSRIVVPKDATSDVRQAADLLAHDLAAISGVRPAIAAGAAAARGDIRLVIGDSRAGSASREAYDLDVAAVVTVRAASAAGLYYGTQSLLQMLGHDPHTHALPQGAGTDWPDYATRLMMIDVGRKYYKVSALENQMREMAWLKMNTLHLHFTDWPAFRLDSPRFPGLAPKESYNRADIARLQATARRYHIMIIPEIDLPAHASALIRYRPSLAFGCEALRQSPWLERAAGDDAKKLAWVVDITREQNRAFLKQLLDEFIPWFDGPYFHIGGDEYNYDVDKNRCPELLDFAKAKGLQYPGDVFVDWINQTDKIVRSHGKTTVIWSWWRFKDDKTSIEPDKHIVIDAWNTPRLKEIVAAGYKVLISPEDQLYVVPGLEGQADKYGVVDTAVEYGKLDLLHAPSVLGYGLALWADGAEQRSDTALLGRAYEPMAVLAERVWSDRGSPSIDGFFGRLNRVGAAPRAGSPPPE